MDLSAIRINKEKESKGVWIDIDTETKILVASDQNPEYKQMLKKKLLPFQKSIRLGTMKDEAYDAIVIECVANHVLLGWKGLTEDGKAIKYSVEKATELLSDEKYRSFLDFISSQAMDLTLFRDEAIEDIKEEIKK